MYQEEHICLYHLIQHLRDYISTMVEHGCEVGNVFVENYKIYRVHGILVRRCFKANVTPPPRPLGVRPFCKLTKVIRATGSLQILLCPIHD